MPLRPPAALALVTLIALLLANAPSAIAQHDCEFGGEEAGEKLDRALELAKSCKEAAALFNDCRWGSSADSGFGATTVQRCEKDFYSKLSAKQQNNYIEEMQLCAYEFSRQQGTISISEAASCQVDLAASIAADHHVADKPVPRASFDCTRAQSALEKAICADTGLGRADVLLGRIYAGDLKQLNVDSRPTFVENEKKWLKGVPQKCGLSQSQPLQKTMNCLRNEFEIRFSSLDSCADDGISGCLSPDSDPQDYGEADAEDPTAPRASFDCGAPKTSLQLIICDDHDLGQKDLDVARVLDGAISKSDPAGRKVVEESQRKWIEFVGQSCPLGVVGGIPNIFTRGCIRSAYNLRAKQLRVCSEGSSADRGQCLNDFKVVAP